MERASNSRLRALEATFRVTTWLSFKTGVIVESWDSWNFSRLLESLK